MDHCILFRNTNGQVGYVADADGEIMIFPDQDAAITATETVPACQAYPWQIVCLDEL